MKNRIISKFRLPFLAVLVLIVASFKGAGAAPPNTAIF